MSDYYVDQEYRVLRVDSLVPHDDNPNQGNQKLLEASIEASGFYGAVTVRPHPDEADRYQILAGEHRWRDALKKAQSTIPAIVLHGIDDVRAVQILWLDNEVTRQGTYKPDALDRVLDQLGDLRGQGFDNLLEGLGKRLDEEEAAKTPSAPPEAEEAAFVADAYGDTGGSDAMFQSEYGVLVMADSEVAQKEMFEELAAKYGHENLRVVSI